MEVTRGSYFTNKGSEDGLASIINKRLKFLKNLVLQIVGPVQYTMVGETEVIKFDATAELVDKAGKWARKKMADRYF